MNDGEREAAALCLFLLAGKWARLGVTNGGVRAVNFVFFSPHFPDNSTDFCERLAKAGATVLGVGDAPYDALNPRLKAALAEYYRIADLENEDLTLRALGHFVHRWGRLDRFESLNEHWLELEAQMRTDFNIFGTKLDFVRNL